MTTSFISGFVGAITGLLVYVLVLRPFTLMVVNHTKAKYWSWRKAAQEREFRDGQEWAWAMWGTNQLTYNAINGWFSADSTFGKGVHDSLSQILPLEKDRQLNALSRLGK